MSNTLPGLNSVSNLFHAHNEQMQQSQVANLLCAGKTLAGWPITSVMLREQGSKRCSPNEVLDKWRQIEKQSRKGGIES